jgi:multiple sugar transport system permease protein
VLQVYGEPTTLRGLASVISSTWSPLMFVYRLAFTENDTYAASAAAIVIALVTLVLSFAALRVVQQRAFAQEDQ